MKTRITALTLTLALVMTGCVPVPSLHPLYTEKDTVFEPKLLGTWQGPDAGDGTWTFAKAGENAYQVILDNEKGEQEEFTAHLVRLKKHLFLDAQPRLPKKILSDYEPHVVVAHTFYRVAIGEDSVRMAWLDDKNLAEMIQKKQVKVKHEEVGGSVLLTASPEELQAFFERNAENKELFREEDRIELRRKKTAGAAFPAGGARATQQ